MESTMQISKDLLDRLAKMKMYEKESYENVVWDLIEDRMEFSKETKMNIEKSEKEIKEGRIVSLEQIKKKLKI